MLVRTAAFNLANQLVGVGYFQQAVDRSDAAYQAKPGEVTEERLRESIQAQGVFGCFPLARSEITTITTGKDQGHYPADDARALEVSDDPPGQAPISPGRRFLTNKLTSKRSVTFSKTGSIVVSAAQIQRVVQRVGSAACLWQERAQLSRAEPTLRLCMSVLMAQVMRLHGQGGTGRTARQTTRRQSQNPPGLSGLRLYP